MISACPGHNGPKRRRRARQLKLFEKATPGESVQIDVKFVKVGGARAYQYTARDDCTRLRVLRLYRRLHVRSSLDFVAEVTRTFPFTIQKIQTASSWSCSAPGSRGVTLGDDKGDDTRDFAAAQDAPSGHPPRGLDIYVGPRRVQLGSNRIRNLTNQAV